MPRPASSWSRTPSPGLGTDRDLRLHLVQWPSSLHPDTTWWVVSFPVVLGLFLVVVLSLGVWLSQGVRDTRRPVGIVGRRLPAVRAVAVAGLLGLLGVPGSGAIAALRTLVVGALRRPDLAIICNLFLSDQS